jgi:uncharacterized integral membrane protein (TIGR00697 family)
MAKNVSINPEKGRESHVTEEYSETVRHFYVDQETKFIILTSLFIALLMVAVLTGSKIVTFLGLTFSAGTLPAALTFMMTDAICERWGKPRAKKVVVAGLISWIVMLLMIYIAIIAPPAPFWDLQTAYAQIFGTSMRLILGGFLAYTIAQFHDIWSFDFWKNKTNGKHLWLRNNFSTAVSQLLNTAIIVVVGFYGSIPDVALLSTIFGWWLIKLLIAVFDTPFVYLIVRWVK